MILTMSRLEGQSIFNFERFYSVEKWTPEIHINFATKSVNILLPKTSRLFPVA